MFDDVKGGEPEEATDDSGAESAEEIKLLQARFDEALQIMRKTGSKKPIYDLPWYIIIGPPGSGKTTALINSGLKFPLAKESGGGAIQGIGGTRNCDWWFTDQGIIIDTAGRYTTQDSHKELDSSAWQDFLLLLKKFRKRRPINGVFVSVSVQELLLQTPEQRALQVAAISNRLQELREAFKVEFPVYVLITKTDLISGFEEYFDSYSKAELDQVWGVTFPYEKKASNSTSLGLFSSQYDQLLQTVNQRLIPRLHQERDQQRAEKISSFPKQLHVIKPLLERFLTDVFENSRFSQPLLLRGFYFCSGTQEGTPIDRLMNKLGGAGQPVKSHNKGRSFFIKNLFENIVFKESGLVGTDIKFEKKLRLFNLGAIAAISIASLTVLGGWTLSYFDNREFINHSLNEIASAQTISDQLSATELDIIATLPLLNAARSLPAGYDVNLNSTSLPISLGLSQQEKIGNSANASYLEILNKILLSRLMLQTEYSISDHEHDDTYTYAALRTYLMLGSEQHYNGDEVSSFYRLSWLQPLARELSTEQYQQLSAHIEVLFQQRPVPLPMALDAALIKKAQLQLANTPLDRTIYSRLKQIDLAHLPPFTVYDKAGQQQANRVFVRKSGRSLSEGIESLYTKAAHQQVMNEEIDKLTEEVIEESWVYGDDYRHNRNIDKESLASSVKTLYQKDYIAAYESLLTDLDIAPFTNYDDAALVLNTLSGQTVPSPLQQLLLAVKEETQFGLAQVSGNLSGNSKLKAAQEKLKRILGSSSNFDSGSLAQSSDPITRRFAPLHRSVIETAEGRAIPLNTALTQFDELYGFMNKVSLISRDGALDSTLVKTGEEKILRTRQAAKSQPSLLVAPFMNSVANRTASLAFGGALIHINQLWAEESYEYCLGAVENRYPFVRNSNDEISLADFGAFFGYRGVMHNFFNDNLKDYIDTTKTPWRVYKDQQSLISISPEALTAFEKAHYIKKSFFKVGEKQISTLFKVKPQQLDDGLRGFYLNLDGQSISYEFGPLISSQLNWPGPQPSSGAHFTLRPVNGNDISIYAEGDWAWFRLLDKIQMKRASNTSNYNVKFLTPSGYSASYGLVAGSAHNPYRIASRMSFKCPAVI
ncbi:MAG: type VI secretion system membrane subunit TssM [Moraxellaceae bacterium]|nr:MAG: type VI secretion system membrane subunit TssM [Moraxellaceae bacterium]